MVLFGDGEEKENLTYQHLQTNTCSFFIHNVVSPKESINMYFLSSFSLLYKPVLHGFLYLESCNSHITHCPRRTELLSLGAQLSLSRYQQTQLI